MGIMKSQNFEYFLFPTSNSNSSSVGLRFLLVVGLVLFFQCQSQFVAGLPNKGTVDLQTKAVIPNACETNNTVFCTAEFPIFVNSTGTHIYTPTTYTSPISCRYEIPKKNGVCQIRLDFITFEMAQPSSDPASMGDCIDDALTITGADKLRNFQICGRNKGQHLYLHYGSSNTISLTTRLRAEKPAVFDILVTFITCNDDAEAAPAGCTQYFTEPSGTVKSFNYDAFPGNGNVADNQEQFQLNNQLYSVCVKADPGASEIKWESCKNGAFAISGTLPTPSVEGRQDQECPTDYVNIPGGNKGARYCGSSFPGPVTSGTKPFSLDVNFDDVELLGPNYERNPVTGCCSYCVCKDGNGGVVDNQLCIPPNACEMSDTLRERSDLNNIGFCLTYTVD